MENYIALVIIVLAYIVVGLIGTLALSDEVGDELIAGLATLLWPVFWVLLIIILIGHVAMRFRKLIKGNQ